MSAAIAILSGTFRKEFLTVRRYPLQFLTAVGAGVILAVASITGLKEFLDPEIQARGGVELTVVSVLTLFVVAQAPSFITSPLAQEAMQGTMEQVAMSRFGIVPVTLLNGVAMTVMQSFIGVVGVGAATIAAGVTLHLGLVSIIVVMSLMLAPALAIGAILGGLTLLFKRLGAVSTVIRLGLLAAVAAPVGTLPILKVVPVALGASMLRRVIVHGDPLSAMAGDLFLLTMEAVVFVAVGVVAFRSLERATRRRGVLGHY